MDELEEYEVWGASEDYIWPRSSSDVLRADSHESAAKEAFLRGFGGKYRDQVECYNVARVGSDDVRNICVSVEAIATVRQVDE